MLEVCREYPLCHPRHTSLGHEAVSLSWDIRKGIEIAGFEGVKYRRMSNRELDVAVNTAVNEWIHHRT
jgi:hypothetical protein